MIGNGFALRNQDGVPYYCCVALDELGRIRHGFSTRCVDARSAAESTLNLGFVPWDEQERVSENRERFLTAVGLGSAVLTTLSQIHSDRVLVVAEPPVSGNRPEGDALVTERAGIALAVLVADCFPILLADRASGAIAAIHSGWRGTADRIVAKSVELLRSKLGSRPEDLVAAIGPGIRSCCMEVGTDVARLFIEACPGAVHEKRPERQPQKYMLDLAMVVRLQLAGTGIPADSIYDLGLCTRCSAGEFFSYRAEGLLSGRQMAVIGTVISGQKKKAVGSGQ